MSAWEVSAVILLALALVALGIASIFDSRDWHDEYGYDKWDDYR